MRPAATPSTNVAPTVKVRWLATAFAMMFVLAALCAYVSLCLLFYQGQWQILFHPSPTVSKTPASGGLAFDPLRFDTLETGVPQLTGWWLPGADQPGYTILYLHGGDGSLSDTLPALENLRPLGANILAIDYRGFGQSAPLHPSETSMLADAEASLSYLQDLRHVPPAFIIVYGRGLAATIAAEAAAHHSGLRAVILEDVSAPARTILAADPRTGLLPVRLLTTSRFAPADALTKPGPPRLFVGYTSETLAAYQSCVGVKAYAPSAAVATIRAFLKQR